MDAFIALIEDVANNPWGRGVLYGGILVSVLLGIVAYAVWYERKFSAKLQNRVGPQIVGPLGLFQPIADSIKLMRKEFIVPRAADGVLFRMAPPLVLFFSMATAAVIPFGPGLVVAPMDVGLLWVLAFSGLMVFPIWIAGWSSNNKYALIAGMRAMAQGISYEVPMFLAALVPVVMAGSFNLTDIVEYQIAHGWIALWPPGPGLVALVLFFMASLAESNRIPFDIPEAESELVAGVTTEYSAMPYTIFPMAEYLHTFLGSALISVLFLGGWDGPFAPGLHWMLLKTVVLFLFIFWLRWTLVRFRADQLMRICWVYLVPISLVTLCAAALFTELVGAGGTP